MFFIILVLKTAERTWFVDSLFEAMLWLAGSFFLSWKVEQLFGLSDGTSKIIFLVFLLMYFPYAMASILKFGMTLLPRFVGKVNLVPVDGSTLNANHVRQFLLALVCENLFILFTGGIGFFVLMYGRRKHGSTWHYRKSNTRIQWVTSAGLESQAYGGSIFSNAPPPRSALAKWMQKTFKK